MTRTTRGMLLGVAAALAIGAAHPAHAAAQDTTRDTASRAATATVTPPVARAIYDGTMSPYCPGLLLASCPSPQADSLRRAIAQRAAAGESEASIMASLVATYGDVVRASPEGEGLGLVAWLAPFCAIVAGGLLVRRFLGRSVGDTPASAPHDAQRPRTDDAFPDDATAEERAALDALLRRG